MWAEHSPIIDASQLFVFDIKYFVPFRNDGVENRGQISHLLELWEGWVKYLGQFYQFSLYT